MPSRFPGALAAVFASLTLFGCSAVIPVPEGEPDQTESREERELRERFEDVAARLRAACVASDHQAYYRKTACLPSGITGKMLADRSSITKAERTAAAKVFAITNQLNRDSQELMLASGVPAYMKQAERSRREIEPKIQAMQNALLRGRITWGEYNRMRIDLAEESARVE